MATKISWLVGILLIVGFLGFLGMRLFSPRPDAPTTATTKAGVLEIIKPAMPISEILGSQPSGKNNAGEYYNDAVLYFRENKKDFKEIYNQMTAGTENPQMFGWQEDLCLNLQKKLAPAAECETMKYTLLFTPDKLTVSGKPDGQDDLYWLKNMLELLCMSYQHDSQWQKAVESAKTMLLLGWHMTQDDSRAMYQITGLDIQADAAQRLAFYYGKLGNTKMSKLCDDYYNQAITAGTLAHEKYNNVWNLRQRPGGKQGPFPGDLFNIIENDQSRGWKVDALLAMSIAKLQEAKTKGNHAEIERLYDKYSQCNDPLLRAAAKASQTATKDDIENAMRGDSE
ncbi:MAG TPA: hypothetical protein PKK48_04435 [Phycisphaerae bacterium]|nr:hypothetical protein [Phycisphaerae bacterium]HPS52767.1 hypothetical protein [Phycisphaerae bacterium]